MAFNQALVAPKSAILHQKGSDTSNARKEKESITGITKEFIHEIKEAAKLKTKPQDPAALKVPSVDISGFEAVELAQNAAVQGTKPLEEALPSMQRVDQWTASTKLALIASFLAAIGATTGATYLLIQAIRSEYSYS